MMKLTTGALMKLPKATNWMIGFFAMTLLRPALGDVADAQPFRIWQQSADGTPCFGYCDKNGNTVIEPRFDEAYDFRDGLARVRIGDVWCYVRTSGEVSIRLPSGFAYASDFSDGVAIVNRGGSFEVDSIRGGTWGYVDQSGSPLMWFRFPVSGDCPLNQFRDARARIKIGGKWGFYDKHGKLPIEPKFDEVSDFSEGVSAVRLGKEWRYIDRDGIGAVGGHFDRAAPFSEGLAAVTKGEHRQFINKSGGMVFEFDGDWGESSRFSEHSVAIYMRPRGKVPDGTTCADCGTSVAGRSFGDACPMCGAPIGERKWGFLNERGALQVPPSFVQCKPFMEHLAAIRQSEDGPWGFIDSSGTIVIPCTFSSVGAGFSGGLCEVLTRHANSRVVDGMTINEPLPYDGLVDHSGHFVWRSPNLREAVEVKTGKGCGKPN